MYTEATIVPASGGFGEFEQQNPNGDWWEDDGDLLCEILSNEPDAEKCPEVEIPAIRNQDGVIYRIPDGNEYRYFAIVSQK